MCAAVAIVFTLIMRYDTFGYDEYLPKAKKIESVAVEVNGLDRYRNTYTYTGSYMDWTEELEQMELKEINAIYPYLESLVADNTSYWEMRENGRTSDYMRVNVAYRLKNGRTVYREYSVEGIREDLFAPVFESKEYKEVHYSDIYTVPEHFVESITANHAMNVLNMSLTDGERTEFMTILRRELTAQTIKEKLNTLPVAVLNLTAVDRTPKYDANGKVIDTHFDYTTELPIYPSYTETLRFLAERGFVPDEEYEWTGKEMMRVRLPELKYTEEDGYVGEVWETEGVELYEIRIPAELELATQTVAYPKDWEYGENVIPVDPEDYERLYELCTWEDLYYYGKPGFDRYECYVVSLDVPRAGYNMYETYQFVVPVDTDMTFLFD